MTERRKHTLVLYTISHFIVDLCCFVMLFQCFSAACFDLSEVSLGFLAYNLIAFGTQPFIGMAWDSYRLPNAALLGVVFIIIGLVFWPIPWLCLCICAFGNAVFHIGGGIDSLVRAKGKLSRSGIFVSSGALGVAVGTQLGQLVLFPSRDYIALALLCGAAIWRWGGFWSVPVRCTGFQRLGSSQFASMTLIALYLLSIIVRAAVGVIVPIPWRASFSLLPAVCACLGKALGGFGADWKGARSIGILSLLLALPLFLFANGQVLLCSLGLIFINMTMSVTLCGLVGQLPEFPGLAFGLTTLGLLCGTLPSFFVAVPPSIWQITVTLLILISALCIKLGVQKKGVSSNEPTTQVFKQ